MIDIEQLQTAFKQATERAIKLHDALDIPYITGHNGQAVEMSHGKVLRVIEPESDAVQSKAE
jgi:hypothetical protein